MGGTKPRKERGQGEGAAVGKIWGRGKVVDGSQVVVVVVVVCGRSKWGKSGVV